MRKVTLALLFVLVAVLAAAAVHPKETYKRGRRAVRLANNELLPYMPGGYSARAYEKQGENRWLEDFRLADSGRAESLYQVGTRYLRGISFRFGDRLQTVEKDEARGESMIRRAASMGLPAAMHWVWKEDDGRTSTLNTLSRQARQRSADDWTLFRIYSSMAERAYDACRTDLTGETDLLVADILDRQNARRGQFDATYIGQRMNHSYPPNPLVQQHDEFLQRLEQHCG